MNFNKILIFFIYTIIISINLIFCENKSEEDIKSTIESKTITYGSSLRIQNSITKYHLSSFGMNWSSGSGLQIITAVESDKEINGLFTIKEGETYPMKVNGEPVLCGDVIRLEHVATGKIFTVMILKVLLLILKRLLLLLKMEKGC